MNNELRNDAAFNDCYSAAETKVGAPTSERGIIVSYKVLITTKITTALRNERKQQCLWAHKEIWPTIWSTISMILICKLKPKQAKYAYFTTYYVNLWSRNIQDEVST